MYDQLKLSNGRIYGRSAFEKYAVISIIMEPAGVPIRTQDPKNHGRIQIKCKLLVMNAL